MSTINERSNQAYKANLNEMDYVDAEGNLHLNVISRFVLVRTEEDLALLTDYPVGSMAFTAGWQIAWQLGADATWTEMGGSSDGGSDEEE